MRNALLATIFLVAAGGAFGACLKSSGRTIYAPDRHGGDCMFIVTDGGKGKPFGFSYDLRLKWESWSMFQTATDGTLRKVQIYKLQLDIEEGLATPDDGWRTPFNDLWHYYPIRTHRPFTKWRPDGRLWQQITVLTNGDGYLITLEERFYQEEQK